MKATSRFFLLLAIVASVVFSAEVCSASGFALYEGSARGNALGGAMVGRADDPSALFYNPAGITQLPGFQVMAGATFITPTTNVTTLNSKSGVSTTTGLSSNLFVEPHFYATYQATDKIWLGLGMFSQFGLGTEFPADWPGRYNNYKAFIETTTFNPNIAVKVNDMFSFAFGLDVMYFNLDLKKKIDATGLQNPKTDVDSWLQGNSAAVGLNVAFHFRPYDWLKLGLSYRSQMTQNITGSAAFANRPAGLPSTFFPNTSASGSVTLPDELYFGAAFYPVKDFSVEIGTIWTRWSSFKDLTIQFGAPLDPRFPSVTSTTSIKNWNNVWRPFIGAEYKTTNWLDLRAGFIWDQEAINPSYVDYLVPTNNRYKFSFGPGFHWRDWTLDISYTYLLVVNRNDIPARPDGILPSSFTNGHANEVGCSLSYKFW